MALTAKDSGLAEGVPLPPSPLVTVRVLRGFYDHQGRECRVGDLVAVPARFARMLISNRKAMQVAQAVTVTVEPDPEPAALPDPESPGTSAAAKTGEASAAPERPLPPRKGGRFVRGPK